MTTEKQTNLQYQLNLKPYQPFGIPMLYLLFGLAVASLVITALYEAFI